ncbi:MAG: hypothetical protein ACI4WG_00370 [Erysipelotrichaceae bacterium]
MKILVFILLAVLFIALFPLIKWIAVILLILLAVFAIKVAIESRKIKKEIESNPTQYYNNYNTNKDVIDVSYKEKEIEK